MEPIISIFKCVAQIVQAIPPEKLACVNNATLVDVYLEQLREDNLSGRTIDLFSILKSYLASTNNDSLITPDLLEYNARLKSLTEQNETLSKKLSQLENVEHNCTIQIPEDVERRLRQLEKNNVNQPQNVQLSVSDQQRIKQLERSVEDLITARDDNQMEVENENITAANVLISNIQVANQTLIQMNKTIVEANTQIISNSATINQYTTIINTFDENLETVRNTVTQTTAEVEQTERRLQEVKESVDILVDQVQNTKRNGNSDDDAGAGAAALVQTVLLDDSVKQLVDSTITRRYTKDLNVITESQRAETATQKSLIDQLRIDIQRKIQDNDIALNTKYNQAIEGITTVSTQNEELIRTVNGIQKGTEDRDTSLNTKYNQAIERVNEIQRGTEDRDISLNTKYNQAIERVNEIQRGTEERDTNLNVNYNEAIERITAVTRQNETVIQTVNEIKRGTEERDTNLNKNYNQAIARITTVTRQNEDLTKTVDGLATLQQNFEEYKNVTQIAVNKIASLVGVDIVNGTIIDEGNLGILINSSTDVGQLTDDYKKLSDQLSRAETNLRKSLTREIKEYQTLRKQDLDDLARVAAEIDLYSNRIANTLTELTIQRDLGPSEIDNTPILNVRQTIDAINYSPSNIEPEIPVVAQPNPQVVVQPKITTQSQRTNVQATTNAETVNARVKSNLGTQQSVPVQALPSAGDAQVREAERDAQVREARRRRETAPIQAGDNIRDREERNEQPQRATDSGGSNLVNQRKIQAQKLQDELARRQEAARQVDLTPQEEAARYAERYQQEIETRLALEAQRTRDLETQRALEKPLGDDSDDSDDLEDANVTNSRAIAEQFRSRDTRRTETLTVGNTRVSRKKPVLSNSKARTDRGLEARDIIRAANERVQSVANPIASLPAVQITPTVTAENYVPDLEALDDDEEMGSDDFYDTETGLTTNADDPSTLSNFTNNSKPPETLIQALSGASSTVSNFANNKPPETLIQVLSGASSASVTTQSPAQSTAQPAAQSQLSFTARRLAKLKGASTTEVNADEGSLLGNSSERAQNIVIK